MTRILLVGLVFMTGLMFIILGNGSEATATGTDLYWVFCGGLQWIAALLIALIKIKERDS